MLHSDILCNLVDLNVPPCATKLIISYLSSRSMCVRNMGAISTFQSCPGGGPQGGLLTGECSSVSRSTRRAAHALYLNFHPLGWRGITHQPSTQSNQILNIHPVCRNRSKAQSLDQYPHWKKTGHCAIKKKPPQKILYR